MNEFTTLLNTFVSLKIHDHSKIIPMNDIKFNIASEQYSLAASQIRQNIQEYKSRNTISDSSAGMQILHMMHNSIIDMDYNHHNDYMIGVFGLIENKLLSEKFKSELSAFKAYSKDLNKEESKQGLLTIVRSLKQKEFKHKEATLLFIVRLLSTHDYLVSLKDKYL